jgi:hypothetical protein
MIIIKTWKGKDALARCEKECKETIVVDSKENIDHIELVAIPEDLNMFIVYYEDRVAA